MLYKTILWFVILVNLTPLRAQQNETNFRVNFKVDESILDSEDFIVLDALISEAKLFTYYELTLTAHTDNDGSNSYNFMLSNKRAESVINYLQSNGLNPKVMDIAWYGEKMPEASNTSNEGKALNRRVEVNLRKYQLNGTSDLLKATGGDYAQQYNIDPSKDNTIVGKNGTRVFIPKNSILTSDGRVLGSEIVNITLEEFLNPNDAIFNQLSTLSNGKILESGGMFNLNASYNGQQLKIKQGESIQVEMPSLNLKNDMQIFVGEKNTQGITVWNPTAKPFGIKSNKKVDMPFVKIDTDYLKKLKQVINYEKMSAMESIYQLPKTKARPLAPKIPVLSKYPDALSFFSKTDRLFKSKAKRARILQKEHDRIDRRNEAKMARYQKSLEIYNTLVKSLSIDSMMFITGQDAFYDWLKTQKKLADKSILEYEKLGFNHAIDHLIDLSNANKLKENLTPAILVNNSSYTSDEHLNYLQLLEKQAFINQLIQTPFDGIVSKYSVQGRVNLDRYLEKESRINYYEVSNNKFTANFIKTQPHLVSMFNKANEELMDKRDKMGVADMNMVNTVYQASISNFGPINCDRFANTPQLVNVKINCEKEAQISFFIPSMNSYLYANKNGLTNQYEVNLPAGTAAIMVVVGLHNNSPVFEKHHYKITKNLSITAAPIPTTLKQIKQQVSLI
ncbi:MAG: OmpA family protein [bacterium]|nr:OmpA family protein [bacterium]